MNFKLILFMALLFPSCVHPVNHHMLEQLATTMDSVPVLKEATKKVVPVVSPLVGLYTVIKGWSVAGPAGAVVAGAYWVGDQAAKGFAVDQGKTFIYFLKRKYWDKKPEEQQE
jgi:hypothetical protein